MAAYLKTCESGDCSGGASCGTTSICPPGYFCGFGSGAESANHKETACLGGRCINVDDPTDVLETGIYERLWCSRCEPGYVIVYWDEKYKTQEGKGDCEFIVNECPQICGEDNITGEQYTECSAQSSCFCETQTIVCFQGTPIEITNTCVGEFLTNCSSEYSFAGADIVQADSGRPKGIVGGQQKLKCCGPCLSCECRCERGCVEGYNSRNPFDEPTETTPGSGIYICPVGQICSYSNSPCGICEPCGCLAKVYDEYQGGYVSPGGCDEDHPYCDFNYCKPENQDPPRGTADDPYIYPCCGDCAASSPSE